MRPTGKPGGYPGSAPVAPPPGGAGMGGYPGATLGHPAPQNLVGGQGHQHNSQWPQGYQPQQGQGHPPQQPSYQPTYPALPGQGHHTG